jgi:protein phosphatase
MMHFSIWGWTDVGREHTVNDDSVFPLGKWPGPHPVPRYKIAQRGYLMAIADGVSTSELGAKASKQALQTLIKEYYDGEADKFDIGATLLSAAYAANDAVLSLTEEDDKDKTAITTLVAIVLHKHQVWGVHAGDSRAYRISQNGVQALTIDHSVVQELFDTQAITAQEAINHPQQGVLTRALGVSPFTVIDTFHPISLSDDDKVLLCSDGLSTLVSEDEMADIVLHEPVAESVQTLIRLANHRGGFDNISVIVAGSSQNKRSFMYRMRRLSRFI